VVLSDPLCGLPAIGLFGSSNHDWAKDLDQEAPAIGVRKWSHTGWINHSWI